MTALRRLLLLIAGLNFAYFLVEAVVAGVIGSVSLFADSVDFLEDTLINLLVVIAIGWSARRRGWVGRVLAVIILIPGVAAAWTVVLKILDPVAPDGNVLTLTAIGSLLVNLLCAVLLARRHRGHGNLVRAAWLSARNDSVASLLIILTGLATLVWASPWFDIVVGLILIFINVSAAKEVWEAAHGETDEGLEDMIAEEDAEIAASREKKETETR
ncbi:cation transporter [Corynebacterium guangdongense]|uniref:Co/Zn/Cd efflux system component n=1 Tax=Corynebacterium guangdongense TaxID=1783348 RepID=A0ABU1ZV91_9CORY|nr:cation transporter [Corynebacterium guangdongense]MDR7328844.1 Co/Zn/Cd efflux system component [Corynebacterium guangdongense]WJZ17419.1 Cation efflux family protein [Corynebacterium guangdongense]